MGIKISPLQMSRVKEQLDALVDFNAKSITADLIHYSKHTPIDTDWDGFVQKFPHRIDLKDEIARIVQRVIDPTDDLLLRSLPTHYDLFQTHIQYWTDEVSRKIPSPWQVDLTEVWRTWSSLRDIVGTNEELLELIDKNDLLHALRKENDPALWTHFQDMEFPNVHPNGSSNPTKPDIEKIKDRLLREVTLRIRETNLFDVYSLKHAISKLESIIELETYTLSREPLDVYQMGFLAGITRATNELLEIVQNVSNIEET